MDSNNLHYHIYVHHEGGYHITDVDQYDKMKERFDKEVQTIQDLYGSKIQSRTETVVIFDSGSTVKWRPCCNISCRGEAFDVLHTATQR